MKIKDTDYLYATMRVRANEKGLLSPRDIARMIDAKTPEEAAKVLSDAGYSDITSGSFGEVERAVVRMRGNTRKLMDEICENTAIIEVFALKYDFHNIKTVIKAEFSGSDPKRLLSDSGTVPAEEILAAYRNGDMSALPEMMGVVFADARETLSRTGDASLADFVLDRAYFEMLRDSAAASGSEFLCGYVQLLADAANLRAAVRAFRQGRGTEVLHKAYVPGGSCGIDSFLSPDFSERFSSSPLASAAQLGEAAAKGEGGLTAFERELESAGIKYMSAARYVSFDERPIIAYIAAREAEEATVRIIMAGKSEGLSPDEIKSRLRV